MLHFTSSDCKNRGTMSCNAFLLTAIITVLLFSGGNVLAADGAGTKQKNAITKVDAQRNGANLALKITGSMSPVYTVYELPKLSKIVVDIADASIENPSDLVLPKVFNIGLSTKAIKDVTPELIRFTFTLPQSYSFKTSDQGNTIVVSIEGFFKEKDKTVATTDKAGGEPREVSGNTNAIDSQLPQVDPLKPAVAPAGTPGAANMATSQVFNSSGYDKQRITVDFYKIDLHNVFRMLREVSGTNIVVAQGVSGTLTLALNDVPWDFALDIILNLKDLQKEEQYNTIIIYPKGESFSWPKRASKSLNIQVDNEVMKQEAITISQEKSQPPGVLEAKHLIAAGRKEEKRENLETAVQLYEKALSKWPDNTKLANKIAGIYLAQLNQNAKAVYFAEKALAVNKADGQAALTAAIGHANMQEFSQAQQYFDQSVNAGKPTQEALFNYAVFSENQKHYDAALKLLKKNDKLYGKSLNSMVAQARILDKQGKHESAARVYKAILNAGFRVPPDLRKFITDKISLSQSM